MKSTKLAALFILLFSISVQAQSPSADALLEQALAKANIEHKHVFIKFGASWCGWCKRMDKQMKTGDAAPLFSRNFVIIDFTVSESEDNKSLETPGGEAVRAKFHGESAGLPFWVILNSEGALLDDSFDDNHQNLGCPATKNEVAEFTTKLRRSSDLTEEELDLVADIFVLKK